MEWNRSPHLLIATVDPFIHRPIDHTVQFSYSIVVLSGSRAPRAQADVWPVEKDHWYCVRYTCASLFLVCIDIEREREGERERETPKHDWEKQTFSHL